MTSKSILGSLFFLISLSVFAQPAFHIRYHPFVNQAELAIIDSNYRLALAYYQRAFKWVENGYGRDYHNAALCAIELDEFDTAIVYLNKLVAKGVPKSYFNENVSLYERLYGNGFEKFMSGYEELREDTFEKSFDSYVSSTLEKLYIDDQEIRQDNEIHPNNIEKVDGIITYKLLKLIDEYGFPSEEMLGIDSPYSHSFVYDSLIWHQIQNWKNNKTLDNIRPLLKDATAKGLLHPESACQYFNLASAAVGNYGTYGDISLIQFYEDPLYYIGSHRYPRVTDDVRSTLGLYSLADFEKKARFHFITEKQQSKFRVLYLGKIDHYPESFRVEMKVKEFN